MGHASQSLHALVPRNFELQVPVPHDTHTGIWRLRSVPSPAVRQRGFFQKWAQGTPRSQDQYARHAQRRVSFAASIDRPKKQHTNTRHTTTVGRRPRDTWRWDEYAVAAYVIAEKNDIPLLDTRHMLNSWTGAVNSTSAVSGNVHLNTPTR